ncbi:MAG: PIN domain-containing protein [Eubacterium sp.]|nr:PIN domain-containing protein [Eubacterium sp.]
MRILLDANIILTHLTGREDDYTDDVDTIMTKCSNDEIDGYIAFHTLSIVWYVLGKNFKDSRRELIANLCEYIQVCGCSHDAVVEAIHNENFEDFEDNLQDKCAESINADYIVTANIRDYASSSVNALTPDEFLNL